MDEQRRALEQRRQQRRRRAQKERRRKQRQRRRIALLAVGAVIVLLAIVGACKLIYGAVTDGTSDKSDKQTVYEAASVSLVAVGNNLITDRISSNVQNSKKQYDFKSVYEDIAPIVSAADIAVVNEEVCSYSDLDIVKDSTDALIDAGFDVISYANDHALDGGEESLYELMNFWDDYEKQGVIRTGLSRDADDRTNIRYIERNGLKIAFLSYTYGLNASAMPEDNSELVSLADQSRIEEEMAAAKQVADAIVVNMHWGGEYQNEPNEEQKEMAQFLADQGAVLILGTHPYVCQPAEWLEAEDGRKVFCAYALGNFVSAQEKNDTIAEAMLQIVISRRTDGSIVAEEAHIMPMVCDSRGSGTDYRVIAMDDYTKSTAKLHSLAGKADVAPETLRGILEDIFDGLLIDKTIPTTYAK